MDIIDFEGRTRDLNAPKNWDQERMQCAALPILDHEWSGVPVMTSFWKPDAAELRILNAGGYVTLSVLGQGHPPVAVSAGAAVETRLIEPGKLPDVRHALVLQLMREMTPQQRVDVIGNWCEGAPTCGRDT
jgi:hypothetical protein